MVYRKYSILFMLLYSIIISDAYTSTKTLTYKDDTCYGYFETNRKQNYKVIYAGEQMGSICKDMSFWGWDGDEGASYESCVTITKFDLWSCDIQLEYRTGSNRAKPSKIYGCSKSVSSIPKFCTEEILYIRITAKEKNPSSVEYNITSGAEDYIRSDVESGGGVWLGPVIVLAGIVVIIILVICIRKKRAAALGRQNQNTTVNYSSHPRTQQPISTPHQQAYMYTPVNQTVIPPPEAVPQQQGYYTQQTNYAPQSTNQVAYQQPCQQQGTCQQLPQSYADSRMQQVQRYVPHVNRSGPPVLASSQFNTQHRENFSPPPSYEDVQKQKL